jgi:hypothetical protein
MEEEVMEEEVMVAAPMFDLFGDDGGGGDGQPPAERVLPLHNPD